MASMSSQSAATRVGTLSELVGEFLIHVYEFHARQDTLNGADGHNTILDAALVNRQWNHEAIRLIWQECGTTLQFPDVSHLVALDDLYQSTWTSRCQICANYIRRLEFDGIRPLPRDYLFDGFLPHEIYPDDSDLSSAFQRLFFDDESANEANSSPSVSSDEDNSNVSDSDYSNFSDSDSESDSSDDDDETYGEDFHTRLADIEFPMLKELVLHAPYDPSVELDKEPLQQYLRPTLRSLVLSKNYEDELHAHFPQQFLWNVVEMCPRLERLEIEWETDLPDMSFDHLTRLLPAMRCLTDLKLETEYLSIPSRVLEVIARHRSLKRVSLTYVEYDAASDFVQAEQNRPPMTVGDGGEQIPQPAPFSSLEELELSMSSGFGLDLLVPAGYFCNLQTLSIYVDRRYDAMLQCFAGLDFPNLVELNIYRGEKNFIHGMDLIALARSAPNLRKLCIPPARLDTPQQVPTPLHQLDDGHIQALAQHLPNLEHCELWVDPTNGQRLTEASIMAFGRHCPNLRTLELPAKPDFMALVNDPNPGVWSNLRFLHIPARHSYVPIWHPLWADPTRTARRLVALMPKLIVFDSGLAYDAFYTAVRDLLPKHERDARLADEEE